jgi:hypothetical protein
MELYCLDLGCGSNSKEDPNPTKGVPPRGKLGPQRLVGSVNMASGTARNLPMRRGAALDAHLDAGANAVSKKAHIWRNRVNRQTSLLRERRSFP